MVDVAKIGEILQVFYHKISCFFPCEAQFPQQIDAAIRLLPRLHLARKAVVHAATPSLQLRGQTSATEHSVVFMSRIFERP